MRYLSVANGLEEDAMTPTHYLHTLPGSGAELDIAGDVTCPVLSRSHPSFAQMALQLPSGPLHLLAFGMGAPAALRLAALRPDAVQRLTLVSAFSPLELMDAPQGLASLPLIRAARSHVQLSALTRVESTLGRLGAPLLLKWMTRAADAQERQVLGEPAISQRLRAAIADGTGPGRLALLREWSAYVHPWGHHLPWVRCPVTLWHGTADRWAPYAMAEALHKALPSAHLRGIEGAGHYGALHHVLSCGAVLDKA